MKKKMENREDFEILDVEDIKSEKEVFSHQELVMKAMRRVIEIGGHELVEGHYEEIPDNKRGIKIIYKEDTRLSFIEAIKTCERVMICDYDKISHERIGILKKRLKETKEKYLKKQMDYWNTLNYEQKNLMLRKLSMPPTSDVFHARLPYLNLFIDEEIDIYSDIFKELTLLSERRDFYKAEVGILTAD